jgi:hypothetical protein
MQYPLRSQESEQPFLAVVPIPIPYTLIHTITLHASALMHSFVWFYVWRDSGSFYMGDDQNNSLSRRFNLYRLYIQIRAWNEIFTHLYLLLGWARVGWSNHVSWD